MKIRDENWKRGVLFACIFMYRNSLDDAYSSRTVDILSNAQIEKNELKTILEAYEDDDVIVFLYDLMVKNKI